ncbi:MAG: hypothetical protein F9B45_10515 [Phycisphaera sp. RhM]|nr:hypothetical protein [Phycisphaera sp. RhM]
MIGSLGLAIQREKDSVSSQMTTEAGQVFTNIAKVTPIIHLAHSRRTHLLVFMAMIVSSIGCDKSGLTPVPTVSQTTNPVTAADVPSELFENVPIPTTAHEIYYAISGVGLGGRFKAFRFSGDGNELETFVSDYFLSLGGNLKVRRKDDISFNEFIPELKFVSDNYGVEIDWLEPFRRTSGSVFSAENEDSLPILLLDSENERLAMIWMD